MSQIYVIRCGQRKCDIKSTRLLAPTRVVSVQTRHRFNHRGCAVNESRCSFPAANYYNVARAAIGPVTECTYAAQTFTSSISPSLNCRILKRRRTQIQISICFRAGRAAWPLRDWLLGEGAGRGRRPPYTHLGFVSASVTWRMKMASSGWLMSPFSCM